MPIVPATPESISRAADLLRRGSLVAFPTETVYGLGADATDAIAVARIFEAKGRPRFNPLIVHVEDIVAALRLGVIRPAARRIAEAFWPGPLTLVVEKPEDSPIADLTTAGLDTVALRVPSHPVARALIAEAGRPIAAPSANRSGHVSATTAAHVAADLGAHVSLVLDAGPAEHGLESTVLDVTGGVPVLLRPGAVTAEDIARVAGIAPLAGAADPERPSSPGQLASHYAPRVPVRLGAASAKPDEALLAFGPDAPEHSGPTINLSPSADLREAAARLFSALRELDRPGVAAIACMPVPATGLGAAIVDRPRRAAAPRGGP